MRSIRRTLCTAVFLAAAAVVPAMAGTDGATPAAVVAPPVVTAPAPAVAATPQEQKKVGPYQTPRIGYLDITRIGNESSPGKAAQGRLKAKAEKYQSQIAAKQKQLEKQKAAIVPSMLPEQRAAKAREFEKKVEEYRKPEFSIALKTDRPAYLRGEEIRGKIAGEYLFGGPVPRAKVTWQVFQGPWQFDASRFDENRWFFALDRKEKKERAVAGFKLAAEGSGETDEKGEMPFAWTPVADGADHTYRIRLEATDASRITVEGADDVLVTGKRHDFLVRYDVGFDLIEPARAWLALQHMQEDLLPLMDRIVDLAGRMLARASTEAARACMQDQLDRMKALKSWYRTQRNVTAWVAGVHTYLETRDEAVRNHCRKVLHDMVLDEIANARELLELWETSRTTWMIVSAVGETTFIYYRNLGELIRRKIQLMQGHEDDEPYVDPDFQWRVPGFTPAPTNGKSHA